MTRVVLDGRSPGGELQDRYGDPTARARMASGPSVPVPQLPATAAQLEPAPPDPGPCPTCGAPRANPINQFATGDHAHPSLREPIREADDSEPDPSQFTSYARG